MQAMAFEGEGDGVVTILGVGVEGIRSSGEVVGIVVRVIGVEIAAEEVDERR